MSLKEANYIEFLGQRNHTIGTMRCKGGGGGLCF